jgi:4-hydroxybenzoate polyprenyltransferase
MAFILFSVYGQFYNQIRDFKQDKRAGIKNTTILLGVENTKSLAYSSILVGIALIIYTFYKQIFPLFLIPLSVALIPLLIYFDGYLDIRDTRTEVVTGSFHKGIHIVATIISLAFLVSLFT